MLRMLLCDLYGVVCRLNRYLNGNTRTTPVFDLVHAGPNHRYTTPNLTVHNCVLGLGYQSGGPKFKSFTKTQTGLDLTLDEAERAVADYRARNWRVTRYWSEHQQALAFSARRLDDTHQVELRSGRILTYWEPRTTGREISAFAARGESRSFFYGGKLTENEVQSSCRDILCDAWLAMDRAGYEVILTVHDEIVVEVPDDEVKQRVEDVRRLMTTCSPWAEGLPLGVDICVADVYRK